MHNINGVMWVSYCSRFKNAIITNIIFIVSILVNVCNALLWMRRSHTHINMMAQNGSPVPMKEVYFYFFKFSVLPCYLYHISRL